MKIKKIAAAVLAPTAVAGTVLLGWATVHASTDQPTSQPTSHVTQAQALRPKHHQTRGVTPRRTRKPGSPDRTTTAAEPRPGSHARPGHAVHRAGHSAGPTKRATAAATPARRPVATSPPSMTSGMSAFEQCVAWRESGDNPTASSSGLFGILPATWASLGYAGTAGQSSVALQKAAFDRLYAQYGTQPWAAYDGC